MRVASAKRLGIVRSGPSAGRWRLPKSRMAGAQLCQRCRGRRVWANESDSSKVDEGEAHGSADPDLSTQKLVRGLADLAASPVTYLGAAVLSAVVVSKLKFNALSVVVLSFIPVAGLTAISKSSVGQSISKRLEDTREALLLDASSAEDAREAARLDPKFSQCFGAGRVKALPFAKTPAHLTGAFPGDFGFDPLGLASSPDEDGKPGDGSDESVVANGPAVRWRYERSRLADMFEKELVHGRWAMLGALGALVPEALSHYTSLHIAEPLWWKVGASVLRDGVTINYAGLEGFRIAGDKGLFAIIACQLALMGGPEYARAVGIDSLEPVGIFLPGDLRYPGGQVFDPLNLSEDPDTFLDQAVMEIKHGRLAMVTMLGYGAQAIVTREGPITNLEKFLSDPAHENILAKLMA